MYSAPLSVVYICSVFCSLKMVYLLMILQLWRLYNIKQSFVRPLLILYPRVFSVEQMMRRLSCPGLVRPQTLKRPILPPQYTASTANTTATTTTNTAPSTKASLATAADPATSTTTECPPNITTNVVSPGSLQPSNNHNNLLQKLASSHYQSYTTALTVTIAVGCFLLLLNILIFAGIYHQRDRGSSGHFGDKKKEELAEAGSCSSSSEDGHHFESKHALMDHIMLSTSQQHIHSSAAGAAIELPLQEFKTSPTSSAKTRPNCTSVMQQQQPPSYAHSKNTEAPVKEQGTQSPPLPPQPNSPSIPDPPPPPRNLPPSLCNQISAGGGILRQQGCPQTPGTMKKRVQIQEISVWCACSNVTNVHKR